jgi:hypothetical protein
MRSAVPEPTISHKPLFLPTAVWPHALFFKKVASANEKGKENTEYFLALSGKTAEFAITICSQSFFILRMKIKLHCRHVREAALVL